jgi:HD domain
MSSAPSPPRPRADTLASTEAERACLAALRAATAKVDDPMERHCVRVFLIADRLATSSGRATDREVLLCAAFLHDAGAFEPAATADVYTRDGRRLAERTLAPFGWEPERLGRCLDAIEQHHAMAPRWSMGNEVELMRRADLVDVSGVGAPFGVHGPWLRDLFRQVPRTGLYPMLAGVLMGMLRQRPATIPAIFRPPSGSTPTG